MKISISIIDVACEAGVFFFFNFSPVSKVTELKSCGKQMLKASKSINTLCR